MTCANPTLAHIRDDGSRIFRSWNLAADFVKANSMPFDCGTCIFCRKKRSLELARRCVLHASAYPDNCFLTLTYNNASLGDGTINYSDIQKFKKRLRRSLEPKKIEIFNVHEYGKLGRKHWHLVVFNHDFKDKLLYKTSNGIPIHTSEILRRLWPNGHNTIGNVTEASALYQAQYTQKDIKNGNTNNDKKAKSNHSGIGKPYFLKHYKQILLLGYIPFQGQKMPLPRYFEKLTHKHYCHFYETSAFFDLTHRKKLYSQFKISQENKEIADLWLPYKTEKLKHIKEMEQNWDEIITEHTFTKQRPDFVIAGENALHDLKNKNQITLENF